MRSPSGTRRVHHQERGVGHPGGASAARSRGSLAMSRAIATSSRDRGERALGTDPAVAQASRAAVEVAVEVEDVGLDGHRTAAECRPGADPGGRGTPALAEVQPACIDAGAGMQRDRRRRGWRWEHRARRRDPRRVRPRPRGRRRARASRSPRKAPVAIASRTRRRTRAAAALRRRHVVTLNPRRVPRRARNSRLPSRPRPSANPGPTMSRRIPRLSMSVVAKRSALQGSARG